MEDEAEIRRYDEKVIDHLSHRAHKVLSDFSRLEANISAEVMRSQRICRTMEKRRNFAHHRHRLEAYNARHSSQGNKTSCTNGQQKGVSKPFETFCQRLLLQNKIWSQQKQIKALRGSLGSAQSTNSSSAFKAFCDRLLLSNRIWKLQEEVKRLQEEAEQLKRSRVAAVTRAAKQMVQDVRKERLTEEFVKDLLIEMDEHKRAIAVLKSEHEEEMAEMAEGWKGDYQRLCKEVERLQLAQDARLMEQELSNQLETDLLERLTVQEQKDDTTPFEERMIEDDSATLSCDSEDFSTSTIVGSAGQCSPNKFAFDDVLPKSRTTEGCYPFSFLVDGQFHLLPSTPQSRMLRLPYAG
jgi:molecular chaperone GrpE (heat shock protein)